MLAAAVTTNAMADTQTETLVNTSQSEASNVNHESEGDSIVFSKNDNMKDYTRTKRETGQTPAEPLNTSLLSDKSLTDMLISSTPTKSSVEQSSNFKLFESFHFPHPIDLPDSHDNVSCDSGSKSSDNLTDGINGANIERQLVLEAQLFDARKRIECLIASNQSATAQNELLNSEIDQYRKTIKEQKSQIKKLSNDNDNLRREISKYKGIRKYINNDTSGDMNDMVEKLNIAETKLSSFKQHVLDTANQLISAIDGDSAEELMIPVHNAAAAITRSSVPAATSRSASAVFLCVYTWNFKRFVWYFNICTKYFTMYLVRNDLINECNHHQYIFPDLYFLCPKYLRFSLNGFDVRSKSHCGCGCGCGGRVRIRRRGRGRGNELKT